MEITTHLSTHRAGAPDDEPVNLPANRAPALSEQIDRAHAAMVAHPMSAEAKPVTRVRASRPVQNERPPRTNFAVVPKAPGPLGDRDFDPSGRDFTRLSDRGVSDLARALERDADISSEETPRAFLPVVVRAAEQRSLGDQDPALAKLKVSDIQALADRLSAAPRTDLDRFWLFRLCAAEQVDPRTIEYGGQNLSPQWLATALWANDPIERDQRAQYLAWFLDRTGVPRESVLFIEPKADGTPILDATGEPMFTPEAKTKPVVWKSGVPNWPLDKPFTNHDGTAILSHTVMSGRREPMVDPDTLRPLVTESGRPMIAVEGKPIEGGNFADYRQTTPPQWAREMRGVRYWDVIPELPGPLGTAALPASLKQEQTAALIDRMPLSEIAELADDDLAFAYTYLYKTGQYPSGSAELDPASRAAKTRIDTRLHELAGEKKLIDALIAKAGTDDPAILRDVVASAPPLPQIDWWATVKDLPADNDSAAMVKRLANATNTPHGRIPWHLGEKRGAITLEDAVSLEPTYAEWSFPDPVAYRSLGAQIRNDCGTSVERALKEIDSKLAARYAAWGRGPGWVGHAMKCSDPRSASDHDANLLIVGPAGVGKTNLRSAMMDRYVAAGLAPKGRAVITWTDLGPALTAPDPTRAQVRVTLNGEQRYFKLTELVSELKGCVLGIEEIGKAAPMRRRTPEQEQRLENLCTFMLTYTDHAGPLVADGYDVTGIPLANQGIERRFSTVTLIEPDQSAVQRAIAKRCVGQAQELKLAKIEIAEEAETHLVDKFANNYETGVGHYGAINDALDRAIARAMERPHSDRITVELADVIGPGPAKGSVAALRRELEARKPPLFGLEPQIDQVEKLMAFVAQKMMSGDDPRVKVVFESGPGTGMGAIAEAFGKHLSAMGAATGSVQRIDASIENAYIGVTREDVERVLSAKNVPVIWDVSNWPVPSENGAVQPEKNPLEEARKALRQHLKDGTLQCNLILTGDRVSLEAFLKDFGNHGVPFDAKITTCRNNVPGTGGYLADHGHLSDEALLKYLEHHLEKHGAMLEDTGYRYLLASLRMGGYEMKLRQLFGQEKKSASFSNEVFIQTLVRRMVIAASQSQAEVAPSLEPSSSTELAVRERAPIMVTNDHLKQVIPELATSRSLTLWDRVMTNWKFFARVAGRPVDAVELKADSIRTRSDVRQGLYELEQLRNEFEKLRRAGQFTTPVLRGVVRELGMEDLLRSYELGDLGEMTAQEIASAFKTIAEDQKDFFENNRNLHVDLEKRERRDVRRQQRVDKKVARGHQAFERGTKRQERVLDKQMRMK